MMYIIWRLLLLGALVTVLAMALCTLLFGYDYDGWWVLAFTVLCVAAARVFWFDVIVGDR